MPGSIAGVPPDREPVHACEWQRAAYTGASKVGYRRNVTDTVCVSQELPELVSLYKQDDLPSTALFPKRVCFRRIAHRQLTTNGKDELAIPYVIRKFTQL
jgi:hypothetical protein